ncbi:Cationic peroxidase 1 [Spatholobus suberectus]|nr:Cationic peroxidase 1 [Spatholobus suberectus]
MAGSSRQRVIFPDCKLKICLFLCLIGIVSASDLTSSATTAVTSVDNQLSPTFYTSKCPLALLTIKKLVTAAVWNEPRMGASLLRLHFHDCFVQGCDASVLLNNTATFTGEQGALPNVNSLRGFDVIENIKAKLEILCPGVVSCADILAVAARDSVVAVSAHTIGRSRCLLFRTRIYNESNIDPTYANLLRANCPETGGDDNLSPLDITTKDIFDSAYYGNLISKKGLLHSDQQLTNSGSTYSKVQYYATNPSLFKSDFAKAMVKMGNLGPLTGTQGQIRKVCSRVN